MHRQGGEKEDGLHHIHIHFCGYGLVVFIVYGPNPLVYIGTMTWLEKFLTRVRNFLTPVFSSMGGIGQTNWNL
jgi:hypothetical protein